MVVRLQLNTSKVKRGISKGVQQGLAVGLAKTTEDAKLLCPVDTGVLQSSIGFTVSEFHAVFFAKRNYAAFVEFGHHVSTRAKSGRSQDKKRVKKRRVVKVKGLSSGGFVKAQPFMRPALEANQDEILRFVRSAIRGSIR